MTREEAYKTLKENLCAMCAYGSQNMESCDIRRCDNRDAIKALEQDPQTFKWCTDCREYDQEKHCCHRWSKAIRDTVEEMKQEPVLDKLRAEIIKYEGDCRLSIDEHPSCKQCTDNVFKTIYGILDMHKAESEG